MTTGSACVLCSVRNPERCWSRLVVLVELSPHLGRDADPLTIPAVRAAMQVNGWRVVRVHDVGGERTVVYCPNHGPEGVA